MLGLVPVAQAVLMQTWIWRNLHLDLPGDWEMLQFSRRAEAGRCGFADRYQFRLELSWRAAGAKPDLERTTADYLAKLRSESHEATPIRAAAWSGIEAVEGGTRSSRFVNYCEGETCVVELVFLWPEGRDEALERQILESVRAEPAARDGYRRWRAFGMDLLASPGLRLSSCSVAPARAGMTFREARGPRQEVFQRLGMVSHWLTDTVWEWLMGRMPRRSRVKPQEARRVDGHTIESVLGTRAVQGWGGFVSRQSPFQAAAWVCPRDERLYCASVTASRAGREAPLLGPRLSCCAALALPQ